MRRLCGGMFWQFSRYFFPRAHLFAVPLLLLIFLCLFRYVILFFVNYLHFTHIWSVRLYVFFFFLFRIYKVCALGETLGHKLIYYYYGKLETVFSSGYGRNFNG